MSSRDVVRFAAAHTPRRADLVQHPRDPQRLGVFPYARAQESTPLRGCEAYTSHILPSPSKKDIALGTPSEPIDNSSEPIEEEGQRQERIYEPFPVMVHSVDASGEAFDIHTVLNNFSTSGLYVRLERRIDPGTKLLAFVRLSTSAPEVPAPCVAVRGIVLRAEPQPDGTGGIAVRFTRHRFL
jgi:hypothetical protein